MSFSFSVGASAKSFTEPMVGIGLGVLSELELLGMDLDLQGFLDWGLRKLLQNVLKMIHYLYLLMAEVLGREYPLSH